MSRRRYRSWDDVRGMTFEQRTIRALILLERERIASAERVALAQAQADAARAGAMVAGMAGMVATVLVALAAPVVGEGGAS